MIKTQLIDEARADLEDMRRVPDGGEGHSKAAESAQALRTARKCVRCGWQWLKELGMPRLAATLASLDGDFAINPVGLIQLAGRATSPHATNFDITLETLLSWIKMSEEMQAIFANAFASSAKDQRMLVEACCVAAALLYDEKMPFRRPQNSDK